MTTPRKHVKFDPHTARRMQEVLRTSARVKTAAAKITRSPSDGSGRFVAVVSTFGGEPDSQGDVVARHAFDETISQAYVDHPSALWPVYWQHMYSDPANAIGVVVAASATDQGLVVEGQLDLSNERAVAVYEGLLGDRIREWSISYAVIEEHRSVWNGEPCNVLDVVELLEISAVTSGANRHTRTVSVKAAESAPTAMDWHLIADHGRSSDYVSDDRTKEDLTALHGGLHAVGAEHDHEVADPDPDPEVARYNSRLDALLPKSRPAVPAVDVDAFIREDRELHAREIADEAARRSRMADLGQFEVVDATETNDELLAMLWPAARRLERDEELEA